MFCVIFFTGIRKTDSHVSRSVRVTKESRLFRVPHSRLSCIRSWKRQTRKKFQHDVTRRAYTQWLIYRIVPTRSAVRPAALDHFIKQADRHKEIKMFKKKQLCVRCDCCFQLHWFQCFNTCLPSCLKRWMVRDKNSFCGWHRPQWWQGMGNSWRNVRV